GWGNRIWPSRHSICLAASMRNGRVHFGPLRVLYDAHDAPESVGLPKGEVKRPAHRLCLRGWARSQLSRFAPPGAPPEVSCIPRTNPGEPDLAVRSARQQAVRCHQLVRVDLIIARFDVDDNELAIIARSDTWADRTLINLVAAPCEL